MNDDLNKPGGEGGSGRYYDIRNGKVIYDPNTGFMNHIYRPRKSFTAMVLYPSLGWAIIIITMVTLIFIFKS